MQRWKELRDWKVDRGDIRADPGIAREILEFIEQHQVPVRRHDRWHLGVLTRKESITKANGAQFANFGTDEIGLRGRGSINYGNRAAALPGIGVIGKAVSGE